MPSSPAETSLADLAITSLGDKLPSLLPYLQGFELVTKNDESSRAAGLLGFDIGGSQVMMPVLFLSGKLKGSDCLYLKDSDTFVSASPEWAEYLTSRSTGVTGEPGRGNHANNVPQASLRIFSQPPQISKRGELDDIFEEFINPEKALASSPITFTVPNALRGMGKQACAGFMRHILQDFPELLVKMADYYDPKELMIEFSPEPPVLLVSKKADLSEIKLAFITLDQVYSNPNAFTTEQKEAVFRDGLLVLDKRAREEKSEVYPDDYSQKFHTPVESGFYKMMNMFGELVDVFISRSSFLLNNPQNVVSSFTIIDPDSGAFYLPLLLETILVRPKNQVSNDDFKKKFDKLKPISEAAANKTYIAIGPAGETTAPFKVDYREKTPDYLSLRVDTVCSFSERFRSQNDEDEAPETGATIRIVDGITGKVRRMDDLILVPSGWRIMELDDQQSSGHDDDSQKDKSKPEEDEDKSPKCSDDKDDKDRSVKERNKRRNRQRLQPGGVGVLTQAIQDKAIKALEMSKKGSDYTIFLGDRRNGRSTPRMKKQAALATMVGRFGFPLDEATGLMNRIDKDGIGKVWIKMADQYAGMPFPEPSPYIGANEFGVPETERVSEEVEVPIEHPEFPDVNDPDLANFDKIKQKDVDFLSRAADTNAKNVFDPAMIGTILKSSRTQAQVDQWLPDIVGSLDKLCRLSLLFYWKNSDFAEMYGKDEMAEFEDVLLNSIKVMGTIVLFLKQRAQEGGESHVDALRGGQ